MKYNTTYTPKVSLKDTIKKTEYLMDGIKKFYFSRFDMTEVIAPQFAEENSELLIDMRTRTRPITFDISQEYRVGQLYLTHSNWMRSMMSKLELNENEGLYARVSPIWRDSDINPVSSVSKHEMVFQVKVKKDEDIKQVVKEETIKLFSLINNFETELAKEFKIEKQFPEIPSFISGQMMQNEYPTISTKGREIEFADELNGYVLTQPGFKLFTGQTHTEIPEELYALRNFNQIVLKDFVNSSVLKVASIAQIAKGQLLSDQLTTGSKAHLKEQEFYSNEIKNDYNLIEIKINIGRLVMALLKKGHISEVQPGNISDESNTIASRYKIEKY